jgi:membrane associated rhomboid family serine protease
MEISFIAIGLIILTTICTAYGIQHRDYLQQFGFQIDAILTNQDHKRLLTSGFLHVNWWHFSLNMVVLYFFAAQLATIFSASEILVIYLGGLLGGNALCLAIKRHDPHYSMAGANGAICGLIFASIATLPELSLSIFSTSVTIPTWSVGVAYFLLTLLAGVNKHHPLSHETHLGGGIAGMVIALVIFPEALMTNNIAIGIIIIPTSIFLTLLFNKQDISKPVHEPATIYDTVIVSYTKKGVTNHSEEQEINQLLEKIFHNGIDSLSKRERLKLDSLAKNDSLKR